MKKFFVLLGLLLTTSITYADEGMWLLKELNKQSLERMKELGFTFPSDSIYSETNPSLKDAVVIFGGGCTGVAVSDQGLIFTNHHCGYGAIQKLSSVEHDYLKDGFVSQNFDEELPANGLSILFLQKVEDVTDLVLGKVSGDETDMERYQKISDGYKDIIEKYKNDESLEIRIVPFYSYNKYYIVIYQKFTDVRLVFTPPSSVGKFGGETDNWMWPRHTGDFSVFRVYADKNNKPASYNADNIPYRPKYTVPISIKGYKEKDYAMTIGYPGSTERYMTSWGIKQMMESEHKPRIEVRGAKQNIWRAAMNASDAIRIKYASKYAGSSNYWKNAIGMNQAIQKLGIIAEKEALEKDFTNWVNSDAANKTKYGETLSSLESAYTKTMDIAKIRTYFYEAFFNGIEVSRFANTALFVSKSNDITDKGQELRDRLTNAYKDYEPSLDRKVMPVLLKIYAERVPAEYRPAIYETIEKKFKGDYDKYADWFYKNTQFTSLSSLVNLIGSGKEKEIDKDPAIQLAKALDTCMSLIDEQTDAYSYTIREGNKQFMAGLMEMQPDKTFYPDANFTQRLSYGSIGGYKPTDAVCYNYFTTDKGIFEKQKPGDPEFNVQQYILDNLKSKNWGRYADSDSTMHVNFLSNNDITGGNSGSPVFNGKAQLIGLAFDGNWESLSGDIKFNSEVQRCINVDIRYVLYTIDTVMNCHRIIDELNIVE